ncbi:hypothetical protein [Streptomyces nigrescens]|uniref:hypothetical protein n=1 Tax=Streptomyces nigrescens TaxID=1920 RepID=UPI00346F56EB
MLTFVPGSVVWPDRFFLVEPAERLARVARLIREFHDAVQDWDTAAPGSRLWDVAYAMQGFVPLSAHPGRQRTDAGERLRIFADAYGLDEAERHQLVPLLGRRTRAMHDFLQDQTTLGKRCSPSAPLRQRVHCAGHVADSRPLIASPTPISAGAQSLNGSGLRRRAHRP